MCAATVRKRACQSTNWSPATSSGLPPAIMVPADGVLLSSRDFFVDQALLTGESFPVEKQAPPSMVTRQTESSEAGNVVFAGTSVIAGSAVQLSLPNRARHNARPARRHPGRQAAADLVRNRDCAASAC